MMIKEKRIALGMARWGFLTSSPVVAIQSNPTKPKKQVAAPFSMPSTPKGKKPPSPIIAAVALSFEGRICQLEMSALNAPQIITNRTIAMFTSVKMLFVIADFFNPKANAAETTQVN